MENQDNFQCPCLGKCENASKCEACTAHHRKIGSVVMCMRPIAESAYGPKKEV